MIPYYGEWHRLRFDQRILPIHIYNLKSIFRVWGFSLYPFSTWYLLALDLRDDGILQWNSGCRAAKWQGYNTSLIDLGRRNANKEITPPPPKVEHMEKGSWKEVSKAGLASFWERLGTRVLPLHKDVNTSTRLDPGACPALGAMSMVVLINTRNYLNNIPCLQWHCSCRKDTRRFLREYSYTFRMLIDPRFMEYLSLRHGATTLRVCRCLKQCVLAATCPL